MKNRFFEKGERRSGGKDLDLPARSRSGEGRALTLAVRIQACQAYEDIRFYTRDDFP